MSDFIQCLAVNSALVVLLVLPFIPLAFRLVSGGKWPEVVVTATVMGCSVQAVVGLLWSHLVGKAPLAEAAFFFVVCGVLSLLGRAVYPEKQFVNEEETGPEYIYQTMVLPFFLAAAFLVRSLHPLGTYALGQSDAYTHLHYLRYIVSQAHLANGVYPPGYHWILALPVLVLKIDPYLMARFGGAFFGTGLVLAVHVFLRRLFSWRAAFFGSFCVACFPGMLLLMKTGVGAFANQFGLLLVPVMLGSYALFVKKSDRRSALLFLAAGLGFASAVPMMLIHILILIFLERILSLFQDQKAWLTRTGLIALLCLPPILLAGFHFSQAGAGQRVQTARVLTAYGNTNKKVAEKITNRVTKKSTANPLPGSSFARAIVQSPYFGLLVDFCTVKRFGYSQVSLDLISWALFVLFISFLGYGIYRRDTGYILLGLWGGLTSIQAGTGVLQFTSYQREGWSLLVATSCLCGVLAWGICRHLCATVAMKFVVAVIMVFSILWTFRHPPAHPAIQSSAESLVVQTARFLARYTNGPVPCPEGQENLCRLAESLDTQLPLVLVSRKFVGWKNQGELIPNVLPLHHTLQVFLAGGQRAKNSIVFSPENQYVVLVDKAKKIQPYELTSAFAMVSPAMVKSVLQQQKNLYRANSLILEYISSLSEEHWQVRRVQLSSTLSAYVSIPFRSTISKQ